MKRTLLLVGAALAAGSAQGQHLTPALDLAPTAASLGGDARVLVDSLIVDSGDNDYEFTVGFGFPGGNATPEDPEFGARASSYEPMAKFVVPPGEPFILTGMRARYRTSSVSGEIDFSYASSERANV